MKNFNDIYATYYPLVFGLINGKINSRQDAEELANDVLLKVHGSLERFDSSKASMKTWINVIMKNTLYDYYRKRKQETVSLDIVQNDGDSEDALITYGDMLESRSLNPYAAIVNEEGVTKIKESIDRLKESQALIADLFFNQQMSYEEISSRLQIPMGTVKGTLSRIRTELKEVLS